MVKNPVSLETKATHKYDDILHMEYPLKSIDRIKHPRMKAEDRAKIFMPFAALRGYEEAIAAKQRIVAPRMELSEEAKEYLDLQLRRVELLLSRGWHPVITVVYFQRDRGISNTGEYLQFTGMTARFDQSSRILQIVDKRLRLEDIYDITGKDLEMLPKSEYHERNTGG